MQNFATNRALDFGDVPDPLERAREQDGADERASSGVALVGRAEQLAQALASYPRVPLGLP